MPLPTPPITRTRYHILFFVMGGQVIRIGHTLLRFKASLALLELDWMLFVETFGQVVWAYADGTFGRLFAELMKASSEPEAHRAIWKAWQGYDVSELMPHLTVPTLVVHSRNNRLFPVAIGRRYGSGHSERPPRAHRRRCQLRLGARSHQVVLRSNRG